jgi:hypothetical protein
MMSGERRFRKVTRDNTRGPEVKLYRARKPYIHILIQPLHASIQLSFGKFGYRCSDRTIGLDGRFITIVNVLAALIPVNNMQ